MNKIYVIVAYGGEYDSVWESNLFARYTKDDAELALLELQERDARIKEAMPRLVEHLKGLREKFPFKLEVGPEMPKGPAKPNKETRAAYQKQLDAFYRELRRVGAINSARQVAWDEEMSNYQRAFAKDECGLTDEDLTAITFPTHGHYAFNSDANYRIDELEIK